MELQDIVRRLRMKQSIKAIKRETGKHRRVIRRVLELAGQEGWLDAERELPSEHELQEVYHEQRGGEDGRGHPLRTIPCSSKAARSNIGRSSAVDADGRLVNDGREGRSGYCGPEPPRGGACIAAWRAVQRRDAEVECWGAETGGRDSAESGAGSAPTSVGRQESLQGCLAVQGKVAQRRGRVVPPAAVQDQRQHEVVAGGRLAGAKPLRARGGSCHGADGSSTRSPSGRDSRPAIAVTEASAEDTEVMP